MKSQDSKINWDLSENIHFNIGDIYKILNKLKLGKSPGEDGIHNIFLKNLPFDYINKFILRLVNLSQKECVWYFFRHFEGL